VSEAKRAGRRSGRSDRERNGSPTVGNTLYPEDTRRGSLEHKRILRPRSRGWILLGGRSRGLLSHDITISLTGRGNILKVLPQVPVSASDTMPPRQDTDFMDVDSDSDISLLDEGEIFRPKGKGKGRSTETRKKGKQKRVVGEVSRICLIQSPPPSTTSCSKHILGKRLIRARGMQCKRMRREACKVP
jgi:hypothetical protein